MMPQESQGRRLDQAHRLREWVAARASQRVEPDQPTHVIAVVSGKGGVGKTQVSVNLAIAMAARGHRAVLFDMDMGLANVVIVLGVEATCTWSDVLSGRRGVDEVVMPGPGQIDFVPGTSGVARLANLSEFERHQLAQVMEQIERRYDVAVLDCGAGISRNVIGVARQADTILVVATPEPTSVTDAYAMIKTLAQDASGTHGRAETASIGVVINQVASRREGRQTFERLASVAARFLHLPVMDCGYVLRDDHVPAAVRQRCPFILRYPRCSASLCVMASATRLSREMGRPEARKGLFYRVMNMFI